MAKGNLAGSIPKTESSLKYYFLRFNAMTYYRRRISPINPKDPIDYKDVELLRKFITERGKILPRRLTGLTAKQQRHLTKAIKRARVLALLPFVNPEG